MAFRMVGLKPFFAVGSYTIKKLFRKEEKEDRNRYWQLTTGKVVTGTLNLVRFKQIIKLPRDTFWLLVATYTVHCRLKKHPFILAIAFSANSRPCDMEPKTPEPLHIDCAVIFRR